MEKSGNSEMTSRGTGLKGDRAKLGNGISRGRRVDKCSRSGDREQLLLALLLARCARQVVGEPAIPRSGGRLVALFFIGLSTIASI
jgi:hypothetical protein